MRKNSVGSEEKWRITEEKIRIRGREKENISLKKRKADKSRGNI